MGDRWESLSVPFEPTPGVYALYQRGVLKYIGQSADCGQRLHHHRVQGRAWLEAKDGWETGVPFTARVMSMPDESDRRRWEQLLVSTLNPPCNEQGRSR